MADRYDISAPSLKKYKDNPKDIERTMRIGLSSSIFLPSFDLGRYDHPSMIFFLSFFLSDVSSSASEDTSDTDSDRLFKNR